MVEVPGHLAERLMGQRVTLLLKDGRQLIGALGAMDEYMNLVLEDADETIGDAHRHLGRLLVRGSNVVTLEGVPAGVTKKR